jgi:hypothetical protein
VRLAFTPHCPDHLIVVPDYRPAYGLDDSTRARVLSLIILDSLPVKQAAALNNVGLSTAYRWVSHSKKGL